MYINRNKFYMKVKLVCEMDHFHRFKIIADFPILRLSNIQSWLAENWLQFCKQLEVYNKYNGNSLRSRQQFVLSSIFNLIKIITLLQSFHRYKKLTFWQYENVLDAATVHAGDCELLLFRSIRVFDSSTVCVFRIQPNFFCKLISSRM